MKYSFKSDLEEETRHNILDLHKVTEINPVKQKIEIKLPKGSKLIQKLSPVKIQSRFGQYTTTFSKKGNTLTVMNERQFFEQFIQPADYVAFKKFYLQMVEADELFIAWE